ncbi:MAG: glycerol-3-phosphate acyltransferase [Desulfobacterales bacterium]|jgi:glycerol-3-phosphate acyltransferase PlsY
MKSLILSIILAYLAGSINFSLLLFKILGKEDPRKEFSGNAGVVNVYRQAGLQMAALVWILDMGRSIGVALVCIYLLSAALAPIGGLALILGNRFPCFHQFRGGKGVANYLGFTTIIAPVAAGISALAWLAAFALFRIPFIGSFVMVFILGLGTLLACNFDPLSTAAVLATVALIYYGHKRNIVEQIQKRRDKI